MSEYLRATKFLKVLGGETLPAAFVDLGAFDRNLSRLSEALKASSSPKTLRLATKSLRVPSLIRRALDLGQPHFKGLMTFSALETVFLAEEGFDDFLLAYPTLQASELEALVRLHISGKTLRLVVDSIEGLRALDAVLKKCSAKNPFHILVDVDASIQILNHHVGVRRSPFRDLKSVQTFVQTIRSDFKSLYFEGFMMYEAQIAGLGDAYPESPIKNWLYHKIRKQSLHHVVKFRKLLRESFPELSLFNGGGSGSFFSIINEESITELTVGSALYAPHLFDYYSNLPFESACFFALHVSRSPMPDWVTLQGGGYVASGASDEWRLPKLFYPRDARLSSTEGCGEVQTPLHTKVLRLGETAILRHAKAGELAERFNSFTLIDPSGTKTKVPTYRGCGKCFL